MHYIVLGISAMSFRLSVASDMSDSMMHEGSFINLLYAWYLALGSIKSIFGEYIIECPFEVTSEWINLDDTFNSFFERFREFVRH